MDDNQRAASPHTPPPRDSHDLSLSPREITRDSLLGNMLLSLDQYSKNRSPGAQRPVAYNLSSQPFDPTPWTNNLGNADAHGHFRHHSYTSDADDGGSSSSLSTPPASRDRRDNGVAQRQTAQATDDGSRTASNSRHGRRNTKSSGRASIDTGAGNPVCRDAGASSFVRSASSEYNPRSRQQQQSPSNGIDYDIAFQGQDYGPAPTPTIPRGPRSSPAAAASKLPPPPPEPATPAKLQRRPSTARSSKSSSARTRQAALQQVAPFAMMEGLDSAPAPSVGYNKGKEDLLTAAASGTLQTLPKEKQGFFRRVFGSSKYTPTAMSNMEPIPTTPVCPSPPAQTERPPSNRVQQPPPKIAPMPTPRDTSSSHSNHPALQKKSSSFFRRRKKSFANEAPPLPNGEEIPPVPLTGSLHLNGNYAKAEADVPLSPASSLLNAMDPYLGNISAPSGGIRSSASAPLVDITNKTKDASEEGGGRGEFKREFSPSYEPSPKAKIRAVFDDVDQNQTQKTTTTRQRQSTGEFEGKESFLDLGGLSDNDDSLFEAWTHGRSSSFGTRNKDDTLRGNKKAAWILGQTLLDDEKFMSKLITPIEKHSRKPSSVKTDIPSEPTPISTPIVRVESGDEGTPSIIEDMEPLPSTGLDEPVFVLGEPTEDDRLKAQRIYNGSEDFIQREKAASWMGEEGPVRKRTLQAYMELYDFTDQSILTALRGICARLILRAETQQVDRILVAFSKRWCTCNPNHGFKATDIIHTICYAIMLLNTDLHLADIEHKMTRSQFVKNTISTIRQALFDSKPDAFQRPSILPDKGASLGAERSRTPPEQDKTSFRSSFLPASRSDVHSSGHTDASGEGGPLVKNSVDGPIRAWEEQIESVLKSIYVSIRDDKLPLFGAEPEKSAGNGNTQGNLSVLGLLKRTPSVLSKAPSEGGLSARGRHADGARSGSSRWTSKSRSRPGIGRNGVASSRTSFEDDSNSIWSPAMSSATWSRYSLGRTQGSASQDSISSSMPRGDYQQSIGFANALSQAIIRDEDMNGDETAPSVMSADISSTQLLEDESLELAGPPWIKEGMVVHKHHVDGVGKRSKDRHWNEVFAVLQKGQMSLFSFNASRSTRQKTRPRTAGKITTPVGGGNWQDNATSAGTFSLRLTLAVALPSPGYSRSRPHVWALNLPNGAVHLFQVGTPELIREFVNTANYWSGRLSTHPLVGGISNVEYGWSGAVVNNALVAVINERTGSAASGRISRPGSSANHHQRKSSAQSLSIRGSSFDQVAGVFTNNSGRGKLPGDRAHITPWTAPTQSLRPSKLSEIEQLDALNTYVKSVEEELQQHNQLRGPMLLAFTPRGHNMDKAMTNWQRKSSYLLHEIVKFRTYADCLQQAEVRKREIYKERALAQRAARGELSDNDSDITGNDEDDEGDVTLRPE